MKLIAGLGNPGEKYRDSRHNVGFMAVDRLAEDRSASFVNRKKMHALEARITEDEETTALLKPHTYMNASGRAVKAALDFYDLDTQDLLIVYDELALPLGTLRTRYGGEAAGHNGIKSIITHCGQHFYRLRIGIGNEYAHRHPSENFVLSPFSKQEADDVANILEAATGYMESFMREKLRPDTYEIK